MEEILSTVGALASESPLVETGRQAVRARASARMSGVGEGKVSVHVH